MGKALDKSALEHWRRDPTSFIEQVLFDPETGEPFHLLPAERTFLQHAFKLNEQGRLLYPEQVYSCPKKSGKTGFAAMHLLATTLLFGGRYGEGYALANDEEQARSRVFQAVRRIVEASPLLAREAKITQNRIEFPETGGVIQTLSADYGSAAGGNPSISSFDELWGYTSERSHRLWDEMIPSPVRKISLRLVTTYAGFEGESELLEKLYRRGLGEPQIGPDLYAGNGLLMFWSHTPVAPWQDETWIEGQRIALRPHQFLRMIENRFAHSEEIFIDPAWWDACAIARPVVADPSMNVWVGVDASTKRDSTGIAVVTWDRATKQARLVWHKIFQPTPKDPIDFEGHIEETLLGLKSRFRVREVRYDPFQMAATAQRLTRAGLNMVEFNQTIPNLTTASQNLYELIKGQNLIVYEDDAIRTAISRAVAQENTRGWKIAKDKTSSRIDIVVALAMAALGAVKKGEAPRMWINGRTPEQHELHMQQVRARRGGRSAPHFGDGMRFCRIDEQGRELTGDEANALRHRPIPPPRTT